jgi:hypothetical protein
MDKLNPFTAVGTMFYSGETVPVSGIYHFRSHRDGTCCLNHLAKYRIARKKGQTFPSHHRCGKDAIWRLEGYTTTTPDGR